jgi:streptomycin 6-kinase
MFTVPPALARNVRDVWGEDGISWLQRLPDLLDEVRQAWRLRLGEPYELSFHWVTRAWLPEGAEVVLKLGLPGAEHLRQEAVALTAYGGDGAVRLLDHDPALGALLLQRATPGTLARELVPDRDDAATAAVVEVLTRLHRAPPPRRGALPELSGERQAFVEHLALHPGDDPVPRDLVELALGLFDRLCATAPGRVLLHGDLHHDNVLRHGGRWVAIDPHGWVGDPGFDTGAMLYNPDPDLPADDALPALVPRRVRLLAAGLGMPVERVTAWGFVMAVLSEVWSAQGGTCGNRPLDVARLLAPAAHGIARDLGV